MARTKSNGSKDTSGPIRRVLSEADLVDCMIALPGQLFHSTQIPGCLGFLANNKNADARRAFRDHPQPIAPAHGTP